MVDFRKNRQSSGGTAKAALPDPYTDDGGDPMINSSFIYVTRVNKIMDRFHECMNSGEYSLAYNCLRSLQVELMPRYMRKAMLRERFQAALSKHENNAKELYSLSVTSRRGVKYAGSLDFANILWDWFTVLNMLAHELGLIMIDKLDESEAYKIG